MTQNNFGLIAEHPGVVKHMKGGGLKKKTSEDPPYLKI